MIILNHHMDSLIKRLEDGSQYEPTTGCILWTKAPYKGGHGVIGIGREIYFTHRVSFFLKNKFLPENLMVRHKCDTPECINPDHLILGTAYQNSQDMVKRRRHFTHKNNVCQKGHEFNEMNTSYVFNSRMNKKQRICKLCKKIRSEKYLNKKRSNDLCEKSL